jgi:chromosome segregation ATPase
MKKELATATETLEKINSAEWGSKLVELTEEVVQLEVEQATLTSAHEESSTTLAKSKAEKENAMAASNALLKQFKSKCEAEAQLKNKIAALEKKAEEINNPEHLANNTMLKHALDSLAQQQKELKTRRHKLEEDLYLKNSEWESLQRQSSMPVAKQNSAMELKMTNDKVKSLEGRASELQEKVSALNQENERISDEFQSMGYADARDMQETLIMKRDEEESLMYELQKQLQELSENNEELIRNMEADQQRHDLALVKLRQKDAQASSNLAMRQRMTEALEGQLEASQELTEELQARLRNLESRHSSLLTKMSGVSEQYHQLKFDEARQMESSLAMRQQMTYQMQMERQRLQQQSRDYDMFDMGGMEIRESIEPSFSGLGNNSIVYGNMPPASPARSYTSLKTAGSMTSGMEHHLVKAALPKMDGVEKATMERAMLMETTRRQKHDLDSSYADASAAINMLRNMGM